MDIQNVRKGRFPDHPLFSKLDLRKLIVPLLIEQALALTIGMFDTIMVASVGETAVSGVSLVDVINVLLLNLFAALATGGAIVVGQYLGAHDRKMANVAACQLLLAATVLGVLLMGIALLFGRQLLSLLFGNVAPDVMQNATAYFFVVALSYPFIAIFNASAALLRSTGNAKSPMLNGFVMNGVNIAMNALFIYALKTGVVGAALGTLIARIVGAGIMLRRLRRPGDVITVRAYGLRQANVPMIKRILKIGVPNGLENSIFQAGRIIMTGLVASFGTASIAAHAVGNSLTGLEVIPGQAMGLAIMTVVAQCVGAKDYEQAVFYTKYLMKRAYLCTHVLNGCVLALLPQILGLYNLSGETHEWPFRLWWCMAWRR